MEIEVEDTGATADVYRVTSADSPQQAIAAAKREHADKTGVDVADITARKLEEDAMLGNVKIVAIAE
ncbi:hypothetical protein RYH80_17880 [Halobaculum sp. MBLA0147]|uniref:hypothetical protein n=1 Tax=Halobaculum sp. MBLA0147 TaxID=3079934 RepID=UPI003525616A